MQRREFLAGGSAVLATLAGGAGQAVRAAGDAKLERIEPPATSQIQVAFALSRGATVIDFAGPWEVFQDVHVAERGDTHELAMPFKLYTVASSREPLRASAGLRIVPDYTFADAPAPHVVVVPAMRGSDELWAWLRQCSGTAEVVMSVCTGAFQLGRAGLLDGMSATTHHQYLDRFEEQFPKVSVKRGVRLVDNGKIATAGGLTSGIDMALRVVARYFGVEVAERTASYMEYEGVGWRP